MKRKDFGTIRQLKSGRWQVRYSDKRGIQRSARTSDNKPLTFTTQSDARIYLIHLESDMKRGKTTGDTSVGLETLRERVEKYLTGARLTEGVLRESTVILYRGLAENYLYRSIDGICLGDLAIKAITKQDVRDWHFAHVKSCKSGVRVIKPRAHPARIWARQNGIAVPSKGLLTKSVLDLWIAAGAPIHTITKPVQTGKTRLAQAYRLLHAVLELATEDELIASNPARINGAGEVRAPERNIATPEQIAQLAATVPDRYSAAVILAAYSSMRHSELFGLQLKHVNSKTNSITIEHQLADAKSKSGMFAPCKTDSSNRIVAIPADLIIILEAHIERFQVNNPEDLIFTTSGGLPIFRSRRNWFDTAKRRCGITIKLSWHDLRHTGQTIAMQRGATMKDLQRRAGQSSTDAANRYLHGSAVRDSEIASEMAQDVNQCVELMNQFREKIK